MLTSVVYSDLRLIAGQESCVWLKSLGNAVAARGNHIALRGSEVKRPVSFKDLVESKLLSLLYTEAAGCSGRIPLFGSLQEWSSVPSCHRNYLYGDHGIQTKSTAPNAMSMGLKETMVLHNLQIPYMNFSRLAN